MKVAAFTQPGGPEVLRYLDLEDPVCGPRGVLVQTRAIGLNFADIYRRRGEYAVEPPSPYILGYEAAGVVSAVGREVSRFKVGDRVAFANVPRANAEQVLSPEDKLIPLPATVSFEQAGGILLQGMTAQYLAHDSHLVLPHETVLIHSGGSGVGALLLQYCKKAGARVVVTVSTEEKAESALADGADAVIRTDRSSWKSEVKQLGNGFDVVYDAVGSTLLDSLEVVRPRGHVVFYGWSGGKAPSVDPRILMDRSLSLSGGDLWTFIGNPKDLQKRAQKIFSDVAAGTIQLKQDRNFPLSEAASAHELMESRQVRGKVLLIP